MALSNHIYKASKKHKIPANIYTAILMQESGYRVSALNSTCGLYSNNYEKVKCIHTDFGMAQIHYKSVQRYELEVDRLVSDVEYSVDAGAKILAWFHKKYAKKEPHWYCRYNVGTGNLARIKTSCEIYTKLVSRYL